ncbi:MAG: hypothetical protein AAF242_14290 [Bacteroidota bacterium]
MNSKDGLLRKWILGTIGAKEEAELDQHSKDEPFLADAMEGYRSTPTHDHQQTLDRLRNRLHHKTEAKKNRIIPLPIRSIAAIGLLLLGLTLIWRWSLYSTNNDTLATLPEAINTEDSRQDNAPEKAIAESTNPAPAKEVEPSLDIVEESLPPQPPTERTTPTPLPMPEEDVSIADEIPEFTPPAIIDEEIAEEVTLDKKEAQPVEYLDAASEAQAIESQPVPDAAVQNMVRQMQKSRVATFDEEGENAFIELGVSYFEIAQDQNDSLFALAHFDTYTDTVLSYYADDNFYIDFRPNSDGTKNQYISRNLDPTKPNNDKEYGVLKDYFGFRNKDKDQAEFNRSGRNFVEPPIFAPTIAYSIWPDGQPRPTEIVKTATATYDRLAIKMVQNGPKWVLPKGLDSLKTRIIIPLEGKTDKR